MTTYRIRVVLLGVLIGLFIGVQPSVQAAEPARQAVAGHWASIVPVALTSYQPSADKPLTGTFRGVGSTLWRGTLTGVTKYTIGGHINLVTSAGSGWIHEQFAGRSAAGQVGTLTFDERFTLDASGHLSIVAVVVSGTQDFIHASGRLTFEGTSVGAVFASGTYAGSLSRSA